ncbi:MAG TPA: PAS domain S-box protein [Anaerolineales bacterium]|nr:PAS domain S-box protein [Anaerolineales bacterium]
MENQTRLTVSSKRNQGALKIAGLYLLFGGLWILFSDQLAARIASDPGMLARLSLYKGWVYVLVTALLLYWLVRRHTNALHGGEEHLRLITDALPALISYVGADRRYRFSNRAYQEWFGHDAQGKHIEEVLGAAAYKTISEYVDRVLAGESVTYETEIPYQGGGPRFVSATYVPDQGTNRHVKGFFALVQDITENKRAEEELRLWADAFDGCAHGIAIIDPSTNRLVVCNPAFASLHKGRVEDLVGSAVLSLYAPDDHPQVRRSIEKADQIGHSRYEARMIRRDGSIFPVQMDIVSVRGEDGDLLHRVATAVDITERRHAEEALRESEERYRIIFEMTNDYAYEDRVEPDGRIVPEWITSGVTRITGYSMEDMKAPGFWEKLVHPDDIPILVQHVQRVLSGQADTIEARIITKSSEVRWLQDSAHPVWDAAQGRVTRFYGAAVDNTERKRAEEEIQIKDKLLRMTSEMAKVGGWEFDTETLQGTWTDEVARIHDLDPSQETNVQMGLSYYSGPSRQKIEQAVRAAIELGRPYDVELEMTSARGNHKWVRTMALPIREAGKVVKVRGIFQDITERKQTEEEIRRLNERLEQRVIERTLQLQSANKELEAFSYSVSHDLRAPLRAIDGFARILLEDYEPVLDEEGKRVCRVISREAQHMGQLIDDLLAFSRLGRKEMHSTRIDMKALASSVFAELIATENPQRIDFHINRIPPAAGDSSLIRQVWVNLLSNAVKFSSKAERAVIEVGSRQSQDECIYYVRDNGAGFDMEYVNKLFGVFQRLHSEKDFEGTGVGLAIVQQVIRRHGGRVWAEGEVGKGATFYFSLPRKSDRT